MEHLTNCQVKLVIITNRGLLYEYKSSGFDAKAKTVKRVAESKDETSMAKVGAFSTFVCAFCATAYSQFQ